MKSPWYLKWTKVFQSPSVYLSNFWVVCLYTFSDPPTPIIASLKFEYENWMKYFNISLTNAIYKLQIPLWISHSFPILLIILFIFFFLERHQRVQDSYHLWQASNKSLQMWGWELSVGAEGMQNKLGVTSCTKGYLDVRITKVLEIPSSISLPPSCALLMFFRQLTVVFLTTAYWDKNLGYFTNIQLRITTWCKAVPAQQEQVGTWMKRCAEGFQRPAINVLITEI